MARIGINALYLIPGGVGGTEIYLRELLKTLAEIDSTDEYFVFTNLETGSDLVPKQTNFHWKQQAVHAKFRPGRIIWEQLALPLECSRYRLDVLFNPGFTAPFFCPCPQVTTFHDLQHKRHPEYFRWFDLPFWNLFLRMAVNRSRALIAVSEATGRDLVEFYPSSEDRVSVVHHGVDQAFFELNRSVIEPYLLCVSTLHPHKNLERLIRTFEKWTGPEKLVLAGMRGFRTPAIEKLIADHGMGGRVELKGWVPRKDLMELYARALAFIYPSTFEGFGMPVLEAMAAGVPVACSGIAPLKEVAGGGALFFDPLEDADVANAIERVLTEEKLRTELGEAGRARARGFHWESSARATLNILLSSVRS
jgi:glycosyltransferase involved in cell wall biosynthesis